MKKALSLIMSLLLVFACFSACNQPTECTVTFKIDDEIELQLDGQKIGKEIKLPQQETREGYIFDGWYLNQSCVGEKLTSFTPKSNVTLYGKWAVIVLYGMTIEEAELYYYIKAETLKFFDGLLGGELGGEIESNSARTEILENSEKTVEIGLCDYDLRYENDFNWDYYYMFNNILYLNNSTENEANSFTDWLNPLLLQGIINYEEYYEFTQKIADLLKNIEINRVIEACVLAPNGVNVTFRTIFFNSAQDAREYYDTHSSLQLEGDSYITLSRNRIMILSENTIIEYMLGRIEYSEDFSYDTLKTKELFSLFLAEVAESLGL